MARKTETAASGGEQRKRPMKRSDQRNLPVDGMEGSNPQLDRLARAVLEAGDEHEETGKAKADATERLKKELQNLGKNFTVCQGVRFSLTPKLELTVKGKRTRDEE